MYCIHCDHENSDGSKFCNGCGKPLASICTECEFENQSGSKFCSQCGATLSGTSVKIVTDVPERRPVDYTPKHLADKILRSKSAIEGERKQVTILFADVQGSMDLAEKLDPEQLHQVLDRFFAVLSDGVHRFEGTVNQYTGDGIMALFGAPIAHEDHPQRACYAALHLQDALESEAREVMREFGVSLSARVGIHTGDVVVGKIGDDLRMDYTAQGHSVGLAARMESLAAPGTAYLTDSTASRVAGYFALDDLGEFDVKGVSEKINVFKLIGLGEHRTRFDVSRARGLTRFVGRNEDMDTLGGALEQSKAGHGQIVGIVAEAGTGKSRLCYEFCESCRSKDIRVLEGHCAAHGRNIPFLPILEVFRAYHGITPQDDDRTARERIAGKMLLLDNNLKDVLPIVFEFYGIADPDNPGPSMDADAKQRQLFQVMHKMMHTDETSEPTVILVDDLHWIDEGSEAYLQQMADSIVDTNFLLVINFRPEYKGEWTQRSWYRQIPLSPLGKEAIRELLDDLLGTDESIQGLAEAIHGRTGGNPFFTEEVVQGLIEAGSLEGIKGAYKLTSPVNKLQIPDTVQSILSARIDRLVENEKSILQTAAVIGRQFTGPILESVVGMNPREFEEAVGNLKSAEFIHEESLYPVREYAFKHPLTQEVALNSQLQQRRKQVHASVAEAIEAASPEKLDELSSLLALHWDSAGSTVNAAYWHRRAALWAGITDMTLSYHHWQRIWEILEHERGDETDRILGDACEGISRLGFRMGTDLVLQKRITDVGTEIFEHLGDRKRAALIAFSYGRNIASTGDNTSYIENGKVTVDKYRDLDDILINATGVILLGDAYIDRGHFAVALGFFEQYEENFPRDPNFASEVWGFGYYGVSVMLRGLSLIQMGRFTEGNRALVEAREIAIRTDNNELSLWTATWSVNLSPLRGVEGNVVDDIEKSRAAADKLGNTPGATIHFQKSLCIQHMVMGDFESAETAIKTALNVHKEKKIEYNWEVVAKFHYADLLCRMGRYEESVDMADDAIQQSDHQGQEFSGMCARMIKALAMVHIHGAKERDNSIALLDKCFVAVEACAAHAWVPRLHETRGDIAKALGESHEVHYREALRLYEEIGADGHAERLAAQLA